MYFLFHILNLFVYFFPQFLISFILFLTSLVLINFIKITSIDFMPCLFSSDFKDFKTSTLPTGEFVNLACSIILFWLDGNISSPARNSYLSFSPGDNADGFAVSLLISYCTFSSLILSSVFQISFYINSRQFFLNSE